ncbi:MAG: hypothetical protein J1E03_04345 [Acetatifactor sp.]|nr:hypothetical protein [Acetatifactor sp.]
MKIVPAFPRSSRSVWSSGQERYLPHELGHVVQQKLGLVRANAMHPRGVAMNTDEGLERQADEIGAGKRIEIAPTGNAGTGIVQRYRIMGDYTFAQAPGNEQYSKVMVKNGEPASVYFEKSAVDEVQQEGTLSKLGIKGTGESLAFDVFHEGKNLIRKFIRFGQGRIPHVGKMIVDGYGDIKPGQAQPLRPKKMEKYASDLMQIQDGITGDLLRYAKALWNDMIYHKVKRTAKQLVKYTDEKINLYTEYNNKNNELGKDKKIKKEYIAVASLGYDIMLDMFTLRNIASNIMSNSSVDIYKINDAYEIFNAEINNVTGDVKDKFNEMLTTDTIDTAYILPFASLTVKEFLDQVNNLLENEGLLALCDKIDDYANIFSDRYKLLCIEKRHPKALKDIYNLISKFRIFVIGQRDNILALEIVIKDLEYRHKQVIEEEKLSKYMPVWPTACDMSKIRRTELSSSKGGTAAFKIQNFEAVKWTGHHATPIRLPDSVIGSNDRLFIEDAVGKSSNTNELANAHWVAHIYGIRENTTMNQQENGQPGEYIELECRFNKLSKELRARFFAENKKNKDGYYISKYTDAYDKQSEVRIDFEGDVIRYKIEQENAPYATHFNMDLVKTIADDFVLRAINIEHKVELDWIKYSFFAFNLAADKKEYTIENINLKVLPEHMETVKNLWQKQTDMEKSSEKLKKLEITDNPEKLENLKKPEELGKSPKQEKPEELEKPKKEKK